jgi:hypothetical protein
MPTNEKLYPDTTDDEIELKVFKDIESWGLNIIQPTKLRYPKEGDTFVITGITLPPEFLDAAERLLVTRGLDYLVDKNKEKFDYQFQISNIFLEEHSEYKDYLDTNIKVRFWYNDTELISYISTISISYGEQVLPKYDVKISDVLKGRRRLGVALMELRQQKA